MLNNLEGIKSRALVEYVISGNSISDLSDGSTLEERYSKAVNEFETQCNLFVEKVDVRFKIMTKHEKEIFMEDFVYEFFKSAENIGVVLAQVGLKIGFSFALDTGVLGYKESRGI